MSALDPDMSDLSAKSQVGSKIFLFGLSLLSILISVIM
jgi:hypothetical protein